MESFHQDGRQIMQIESYVGSKTICFPGWPLDLPTSTPVIYDREWALIRNLRDYFLPDFFFAAQ